MSGGPIKLLVSDVDGTLLDPKKQLTDPVKQAVLRLKQAGVKFTVVSARPPLSTTFLIDELDITEPIACFNGALICSPKYEVLHQILLDADVAAQVARTILDHGLDLWMFRGAEWWVSKLNGPHTPGHIKAMRHEPRYMGPDYTMCTKANKLVGVSDDYEAVKRCEKDVIAKCGDKVSATRSSDYYLDVTHHDANKGSAVTQLAKLIGVPLQNVATIGDMPTDTFMFAKSGMSIAMGNASDEVKAAATFTTTSNAEDGYVKAIDEIILPRVVTGAGAQG